MNLPVMALLYGLLGLACAGAALARGRATGLDAALLLLFWPLHGPFLLFSSADAPPAPHSPLRAPVEPAGPDQLDLMEALERARQTPLGALLPDRDAATRLAQRLAQARARVLELDALLSRPDFSAQAAQARQDELRERGDDRAAAVARGRAQQLQRLRALRDRHERELNEVAELIAQLRVQAEVVRLVGDGEDTRDLINELLHRIDGLDAVLDPD